MQIGNLEVFEVSGIGGLSKHAKIDLDKPRNLLKGNVAALSVPEREFDKEIIGDMVKILLKELGVDRECYGSTTFKR